MTTSESLAPDAKAGFALDQTHNAALDAVAEVFRDHALVWARRQRALAGLAVVEANGARAGRPQFTQLELAGTCSISQLTATRLAADAHRMVHVLTATLVQVEAGLLLEHQAEVLLTRTRHCTEQVAQQVQDQVLPGAAHLTPSDLRKRVDKAVLRVEATEPAAAAQRHADAVAARRVFAKPEPDGMGLAGAVLPAGQLTAWVAGLALLERRERLADQRAGVARTCEQRKADLFAALPAMVLAGLAQDRGRRSEPFLLASQLGLPLTHAATTHDATAPAADDQDASTSTSTSAGSGDELTALWTGCALQPWTLGAEQIAAQVMVTIHVPYATALELSHEPGQLDRYGPLSAEHIRLLRPTLYQRVAVDGRTGRPMALDDPKAAAPTATQRRDQLQAMASAQVINDRDEPGHDPSARLARLVDLRDAHCCGPGCVSTRTDRDHLTPHPAGPTSARNLGRLSRRCHRAKHSGWELTRHRDGSTTWRSPLGRTYLRPSPWTPPPAIAPYDHLPPPREATAANILPDTDLTEADLSAADLTAREGRRLPTAPAADDGGQAHSHDGDRDNGHDGTGGSAPAPF